jgi:hypothetical protein
MHRTSTRFWTLFARLPEAIQRVARQNFELLKDNPSHPSLRFKKVGKLWSVRAGINHRALAVEDWRSVAALAVSPLMLVIPLNVYSASRKLTHHRFAVVSEFGQRYD